MPYLSIVGGNNPDGPASVATQILIFKLGETVNEEC